MSTTINPAASVYTKHATVSTAALGACIDQIEASLVGARNKANQQVVHEALTNLQRLADLLHILHL